LEDAINPIKKVVFERKGKHAQELKPELMNTDAHRLAKKIDELDNEEKSE